MKHFTQSVIVAMLVVAAMLNQSCKKDDDYTFTLNERGVFVDVPGGVTTLTYTSSNITSVSATTVPQGWTIEVNTSKRLITVTAPSTFEESDDEETNVTSGTAVLTAKTGSGSSTTASLYVAISVAEDLSENNLSNCYIINKSDVYYCMDVTRKGENGERITPASVAILWQTPYKLLQYTKLVDGKAYFFHAVGTDDDDDDVEYFVNGNAVLGAYDANGTLLWTWHLWCSEFDPDEEQTSLAGETVMLRNLGAGAVSGTDEDDILASYGVYYQWGRREPFTAPYYYNVANGADAYIYDGDNQRVYITYEESSSTTGLQSYAQLNPLNFITGTEATNYGWLQTPDTSLWGATKTANDPCPRGWKVPSKEFFEKLSVKDDITDDLYTQYGYTLTDGVNEVFFPGAGRRSFYTGALTNMNANDIRPTPWTGHYWSSTAEGDRAYAMDFLFDINGTRAGFSYNGSALQYAAGGMQVRCVKVK